MASVLSREQRQPVLIAFGIGFAVASLLFLDYVHHIKNERDGQAMEVEWVKENLLSPHQREELKGWEAGWEPEHGMRETPP